MSKKVQKHCSILNYLEDADPELHSLIHKLCIGRNFVPRRGSAGLTFLRPDKSLSDKIKKAAYSEDPTEAVDMIRALILPDYFESLEEFDFKKSDIPNMLRKKVSIAAANAKKVTLSNGGEVVLDGNFASRKDRSNIAVYLLTKELVPIDGEDSHTIPEKKKDKKKGGFEQSQLENRKVLWENVLNRHLKNEKRDLAMEALIILAAYTKRNAPEEYKNILSQLSYDTLTTLYILLRPSSPNQEFYISDLTLEKVGEQFKNGNTDVVFFAKDISGLYQKIYEAGKQLCSSAYSAVHQARTKYCSSVSRPTLSNCLSGAREDIKKGATSLPTARQNSLSNNVSLCESEVRVLASVICDSCQDKKDSTASLKALYGNCNLDVPYYVQTNMIADANIGFFYSGLYSILRSDYLFHLPGLSQDEGFANSRNLNDAIANDNYCINFESAWKTVFDNLKYDDAENEAQEGKQLISEL